MYLTCCHNDCQFENTQNYSDEVSQFEFLHVKNPHTDYRVCPNRITSYLGFWVQNHKPVIVTIKSQKCCNENYLHAMLTSISQKILLWQLGGKRFEEVKILK